MYKLKMRCKPVSCPKEGVQSATCRQVRVGSPLKSASEAVKCGSFRWGAVHSQASELIRIFLQIPVATEIRFAIVRAPFPLWECGGVYLRTYADN